MQLWDQAELVFLLPFRLMIMIFFWKFQFVQKVRLNIY